MNQPSEPANPIGQIKLERVRFSAKERKRIIEALTLLRGPGCEDCGELERLEIHHTGGLGDNRLQSLRLLCKSCHLAVRYAPTNGGEGLVSVSVPASREETELEKNRRTEPAWVEFITAQLSAAGGQPLKKELLTGNSALYINISVATVHRHWKKYASMLGPFEIYRPNQGTALLVRLRK